MNAINRLRRWAGLWAAGMAYFACAALGGDLEPAGTPPLFSPPVAPPPAPPSVQLPTRVLPPRVMPKGGATPYAIGNPLDEEQLYLEYINRARANPAVEGRWLASLKDPDITNNYAYYHVDTNVLVTQFNTYPAAPPLSFQAGLMTSAQGHTSDMFTNVFQAHNGSDGSTLTDRIDANYANLSTWGENVFSYATSVLEGHAGFEVDWGTGPSGMQSPPGHRLNILNPDFRDIGISVILGSKSVTNAGTVSQVGPQLVTQDFATSFDSTPEITGVIYYDLNGNGGYDLGEGIGGVRVDVAGASYYAVSTKSGGYTVPVSGDGSRTVTFAVTGQTWTQKLATVSGGNNVKMDFVPAYQAPQIYGPTLARIGASNQYSFLPVLAATNHQWRLAKRASLTAVEGAETGTNYVAIVSSSGYQVITNDVKTSGSYSFHLAQPSPSVPQYITLKRWLRPGPGAQLRFASRLGLATSAQVARIQVATNSAHWVNLWTQPGANGSGETAFVLRTNSLVSYAGQEIQVRFVYDCASSGSHYTQTDKSAGWHLDDIAFSDTEELTGLTTNSIPNGAVFSFSPADTNNYVLRVQAQVFGRLLDFGPSFLVAGVTNTPASRLTLTRTTTNLVVRWPTNRAGFNLQATRTVAKANSWTNVVGIPVVQGTNYQISLQTTIPALFLRLQQ